MLGKDLRCPKCQAPAKDLSPEFEIEQRMAIQWTCENGHRHVSGWRDRNDHRWTFEHLTLSDEKKG